MGFIDWSAWVMITFGGDIYASILASLTCGSGCNTYLGYYPWF